MRRFGGCSSNLILCPSGNQLPFLTVSYVSSKLSSAASEQRYGRRHVRGQCQAGPGSAEGEAQVPREPDEDGAMAKQHGAAVVHSAGGQSEPDNAAARRPEVPDEGNLDQAITSLNQAKDDHDDQWFSALARLHLSKAYKQKGQNDKAQEVLSMDNAIAGVTGGYPVILDTEYQRIVKEIAAEHGIAIVDAASELNKTPDVYWDFCHFDQRGHATVGRLVADAIVAARASWSAGKR
jgi:hypothetical protein